MPTDAWWLITYGCAVNLRAYDVQVVISPRNYFLFTPLLPSVAIGTLDPRSIIQPTRYITRHKNRTVHVYEAEATSVDVSHYSWEERGLREE